MSAVSPSNHIYLLPSFTTPKKLQLESSQSENWLHTNTQTSYLLSKHQSTNNVLSFPDLEYKVTTLVIMQNDSTEAISPLTWTLSFSVQEEQPIA